MSILIVTGIEGARNCAAAVGTQLGMEVELADGRKPALVALRRREFSVVVVDETIAECDPSAAEAIWERAGLAIPLQINFALSGAARLVREIRAALHRRERAGFLSSRWEVVGDRRRRVYVLTRLGSEAAGERVGAPVTTAEVCIVACAEAWRGDGEIAASPIRFALRGLPSNSPASGLANRKQTTVPQLTTIMVMIRPVPIALRWVATPARPSPSISRSSPKRVSGPISRPSIQSSLIVLRILSITTERISASLGPIDLSLILTA